MAGDAWAGLRTAVRRWLPRLLRIAILCLAIAVIVAVLAYYAIWWVLQEAWSHSGP